MEFKRSVRSRPVGAMNADKREDHCPERMAEAMPIDYCIAELKKPRSRQIPGVAAQLVRLSAEAVPELIEEVLTSPLLLEPRPEIPPPFAEGLPRRDVGAALEILEAIGEPAIDLMLQEARDRQSSIRDEMLVVLRWIRPAHDSVVSQLIEFLPDYSAAWAIGGLGAVAAVAVPDLLYSTLSLGSSITLEAIDNIGPKSIPYLVDALLQSDPLTAWLAASALNRLGIEVEPRSIIELKLVGPMTYVSREAIDELTALMRSPNKAIRAAADSMLKATPRPERLEPHPSLLVGRRLKSCFDACDADWTVSTQRSDRLQAFVESDCKAPPLSGSDMYAAVRTYGLGRAQQ